MAKYAIICGILCAGLTVFSPEAALGADKEYYSSMSPLEKALTAGENVIREHVLRELAGGPRDRRDDDRRPYDMPRDERPRDRRREDERRLQEDRRRREEQRREAEWRRDNERRGVRGHREHRDHSSCDTGVGMLGMPLLLFALRTRVMKRENIR